MALRDAADNPNMFQGVNVTSSRMCYSGSQAKDATITLYDYLQGNAEGRASTTASDDHLLVRAVT